MNSSRCAHIEEIVFHIIAIYFIMVISYERNMKVISRTFPENFSFIHATVKRRHGEKLVGEESC